MSFVSRHKSQEIITTSNSVAKLGRLFTETFVAVPGAEQTHLTRNENLTCLQDSGMITHKDY